LNHINAAAPETTIVPIHESNRRLTHPGECGRALNTCHTTSSA
jgi:hypothetical protein